MKEKKRNWLQRQLFEIRETIFPEDANDTKAQRRSKQVGWVMFLILMSCGLTAMLIAVSFAH